MKKFINRKIIIDTATVFVYVSDTIEEVGKKGVVGECRLVIFTMRKGRAACQAFSVASDRTFFWPPLLANSSRTI